MLTKFRKVLTVAACTLGLAGCGPTILASSGLSDHEAVALSAAPDQTAEILPSDQDDDALPDVTTQLPAYRAPGKAKAKPARRVASLRDQRDGTATDALPSMSALDLGPAERSARSREAETQRLERNARSAMKSVCEGC